jgi:flagellar biosynthetic protein FlhB
VADPSKTESATPRRRQEARRKGQVARSTELTAALLLLAFLLFFRFAGHAIFAAMGEEARHWWATLGRHDEFTAPGVAAGGTALMGRALLALAPFLGLAAIVAVVANVAQFGIVFTSETLGLKPENLNPMQGLQRIFSQRTLFDMVKGVVKLSLIAWVVYAAIRGSFQDMLLESVQPVGAAFGTAADLAWRLGLKVVLALLALAVLDYLYQRYDFEKNLRMTRQEVKDEYRQSEGDPLVKARIRQLQREASRRRMISEIPKADVVITNPIHLAVAIAYEPGAGKAPRILAKGARLVAERIKDVAREHRIPIHEDPPLAQALFPVRVGAELPPALYHAVAQVLAFVYHANRKDKERVVLAEGTDTRMRQAAGMTAALGGTSRGSSRG